MEMDIVKLMERLKRGGSGHLNYFLPAVCSRRAMTLGSKDFNQVFKARLLPPLAIKSSFWYLMLDFVIIVGKIHQSTGSDKRRVRLRVWWQVWAWSSVCYWKRNWDSQSSSQTHSRAIGLKGLGGLQPSLGKIIQLVGMIIEPLSAQEEWRFCQKRNWKFVEIIRNS